MRCSSLATSGRACCSWTADGCWRMPRRRRFSAILSRRGRASSCAASMSSPIWADALPGCRSVVDTYRNTPDLDRRETMLDRRQFLAASTLATIAAPADAASGQVLRIAMTASDLPTVTGIPNNGGEGFRFLGYPAYDGVVNWDYTNVNQTADATPGLFESWTIDPENPNRWIFTLRQGVTFHDGSPLTMDDIVWNLRRFWDDKSPQYDAPAAPIVRATVTMLDHCEKIDYGKIALYTKAPFS